MSSFATLSPSWSHHSRSLAEAPDDGLCLVLATFRNRDADVLELTARPDLERDKVRIPFLERDRVQPRQCCLHRRVAAESLDAARTDAYFAGGVGCAPGWSSQRHHK